MKKLENELSCKTDTSISAQKSSSPMICRTPSQFTFTNTQYIKNKSMLLYEKLRELTAEMTAIKCFVIEFYLLKM